MRWVHAACEPLRGTRRLVCGQRAAVEIGKQQVYGEVRVPAEH